MSRKALEGFLNFCLRLFARGSISFLCLLALTGCKSDSQYVEMTYGRPLKETLGMGGYTKDPIRILNCFQPDVVGDTATLTVEMIPYYLSKNEKYTTQELDSILAQEGLRPATNEELVAFAFKYPRFQRKHTVVALGSMCDTSDLIDPLMVRRHALAITGNEDARFIYLEPDDSVWTSDMVYLTIGRDH